MALFCLHVQGSIMLLFEGPFGRILHTGDFRCAKNAPLHVLLFITYFPHHLLDSVLSRSGVVPIFCSET